MHNRRRNSSKARTTLSEDPRSYIYRSATFRDIRLADQCTTGTKACVEGGLMTCNQGRWVGAHCPGSQQCFAVPIDSLVRPLSPLSHTQFTLLFYIFRPTRGPIWNA